MTLPVQPIPIQIPTQGDRPTPPEAGQQQTLATGLAVALTTLIVLGIVVQKRGQGKGLRRRSSGGSRGRVKGQIRRRLENKVGAATAVRLVDYERSRVPGKSENWYWEAALERLARDHGRR